MDCSLTFWRIFGCPVVVLWLLLLAATAWHRTLLLAELGCFVSDMGCEEALDLFRRLARQAFTPRFDSPILRNTVGTRATTHKYRHTELEKLLMHEFGWCTRMELDSPKVALVAVEWSPELKRPCLFRSYQTPPGSSVMHGCTGAYLWEAARCSSAAPTYFKPHQVDGRFYVDGGVAGCNPVLSAFSEAVSLWDADNIGMFLSVGAGACGGTARDSTGHHSTNTNTSTGGSGTGTVPGPSTSPPPTWPWQVVQDVLEFQLHNTLPETSVGAILGPERHVRLNPPIRGGKLDDVEKIQGWEEDAKKYLSRQETKATIAKLADSLLRTQLDQTP